MQERGRGRGICDNQICRNGGGGEAYVIIRYAGTGGGERGICDNQICRNGGGGVAYVIIRYAGTGAN